MAQYEKLTLKSFKSKLDAGEYEKAAGARRAVGKVTGWSAADRNKAHELINKHFPDKPAVKAAPKARAKVKAAKTPKLARRRKSAKTAQTAAPVASKAPKKAAPAAAAAPKQPRKKTAAAPTTKRQTKGERNVLEELNIIGERVGTVAQAIAAMDMASRHGADVKAGMQTAQDVLTQSVAKFKENVAKTTKPENGASDPEVAKKFAESAPVAGYQPAGEETSTS